MILSPHWRANNNKNHIGKGLGAQSNEVAFSLAHIGTALAGIEAIGAVLEANANGFYDEESPETNRLQPSTESGLAEALKALAFYALVELDDINTMMEKAGQKGVATPTVHAAATCPDQ